MRAAAVLITVGVLLWNAGVAAAAAATEQECDALGGEWTCHCWMPPPPPPPPVPPLSWGQICVFGVFYGLVAVFVCGLGWMLRFA